MLALKKRSLSQNSKEKAVIQYHVIQMCSDYALKSLSINNMNNNSPEIKIAKAPSPSLPPPQKKTKKKTKTKKTVIWTLVEEW